jgi:U3 small nucleolar RNA-associated protein 18
MNAHFTKNGEEIIMGSRHKSFYYYDMISGKIVMVPAVKALEENRMASFEISPDNSIIAFIGSYGHIHLFSAKVNKSFEIVLN